MFKAKKKNSVSPKVPEIIKAYSKTGKMLADEATEVVKVINLAANKIETYPCKSKRSGYFILEKQI